MSTTLSSAPTMPVVVERTVAGETAVVANSPATTEHELLSAGTADLWRQLAALAVAS